MFHVLIEQQIYALKSLEAETVDLLCATTPTSNGSRLEMHEILFVQFMSTCNELHGVQRAHNDVAGQDLYQPDRQYQTCQNVRETLSRTTRHDWHFMRKGDDQVLFLSPEFPAG